MKNRDDANPDEMKARREKKEKEFQELIKQQQEEKEFQKLITQENNYERLISRKEYTRRRRFVFFQLRGKKLIRQPAKNDKCLDDGEDNQPGCKHGV